jgi:hypothetical protein
MGKLDEILEEISSVALLSPACFSFSLSLFLRSLLFYQKEGSWGFEILLRLLSNKNIRIPTKQKFWGPPLPPALCYIWEDKGGYFQKLSWDSETSGMASEGLGEMFEGDSADMCAGK